VTWRYAGMDAVGLEGAWRSVLGVLEAHLAALEGPFLSGEAPAAADAALFGVLMEARALPAAERVVAAFPHLTALRDALVRTHFSNDESLPCSLLSPGAQDPRQTVAEDGDAALRWPPRFPAQRTRLPGAVALSVAAAVCFVAYAACATGCATPLRLGSSR